MHRWELSKCGIIFDIFNEVYARMMPKTGAPSRSAVGIAALPKGAKVEIEAIAIR